VLVRGIIPVVTYLPAGEERVALELAGLYYYCVGHGGYITGNCNCDWQGAAVDHKKIDGF
jgi:hypothetical protein